MGGPFLSKTPGSNPVGPEDIRSFIAGNRLGGLHLGYAPSRIFPATTLAGESQDDGDRHGLCLEERNRID
jgi:hypothetical protein